MTLVILAAGMGSRYGGLKQIDPITDGGEFIIDFSIFDAVKAGFDKVVFIIKEENYDAFRETVGARVEPYIKVEYAFQALDKIPEGFAIPEGREKPWGTSHALLCAEEFVKDNFAVINADDFYGRDAFIKLAEHLKNIDVTSTDYCMIGYVLRNTLTENGTVSRGRCETDDKGMLSSITELTKIKTDGSDALYLNDNGEWEALSGDTVVSMNCWGLTPDIFVKMGARFKAFMEALPTSVNPLKQEFYLPFAVEDIMKSGEASVKVYNTDAIWYGVTYKEDKPAVVAGIREMIANGIYPAGLWK
jgi:UTP-glucose-1-phosphate uridylyltransferase